MKKAAYRYPLRLPPEDEPEIAALIRDSGQSVNSVLVLCIRQGLPLVREALARDKGRATLVDPLPESVLERVYAESDELENVTSEELFRFQIQDEPE